jgi:hypothetical protein
LEDVIILFDILAFNIIKHECIEVKNRLMLLANKIVANLPDELIERIFLDTDFHNRTLLKIIT